MIKITAYKSEQNFIKKISRIIEERILRKIKIGKIFRIALSGGNTPVQIYETLSKRKNINWKRVEVFLVDERYVPLDDELSNFRMLQETIIQRIQPKKFIYFNTSLQEEEILNAYEEQFDKKDCNFFDLVILGIGNDGHTASLFQGDQLLTEETRSVGATQKGIPVSKRFTLTYPALESSKEIFFLIKGTMKEAILKEASEKSSKLPVARLLQNKSAQVFLGDY